MVAVTSALSANVLGIAKVIHPPGCHGCAECDCRVSPLTSPGTRRLSDADTKI